MGAIQFSVNGQPVQVEGLHPTTTLLQYLREHLRLTGTKEGCAEGDCGACTVALGEIVNDQPRWRAVNACILFLPTLHGRGVVTVEGLSGNNAALHPIQQSFVDHHASQCGFCTPGFIMALAARQLDATNAEHLTTEDVLAGNLCRCTGYRPILDAAADAGPADRVPAIALVTNADMLDYRGAGGRFRAPRNSDELARCLEETPGATILSGGTDVGLWVTKGLQSLDDIVWTGACADLQEIEVTDLDIRIGAAVRLYDAHPVLGQDRPELSELLRRFACPQIRQAGTVVGNVLNASPIGDGSPAFLALGASLELRCGDERRTVALDDFFLGYRKTALQAGEFAETLVVPRPAPGEIFKAMKLSKRFDQDISAVMAAFRLVIQEGVVREARMAFGGVAAVPKRGLACEQAILGKPINVATADAACAAFATDFQPIDDVRASAAYRIQAGQNLIRRAFQELMNPGVPTRILELEAAA